MGAGAHGDQKRVSDLLEQELHAVDETLNVGTRNNYSPWQEQYVFFNH